MMKRLYFLILFMALAATSQAQNDERALAAAIDTIVRIYNERDIVDGFVEEIFQKHNRSAYLATRIAKSYYNYNENPETKMRDFHRKDTVQAFKYIRRSLAIDPKYAQAYVLASDIISYENGSEGRQEAMNWLNRGIAMNPQDSALYLASAAMLAFTDEAAAVAKLEELRKQDPTFPVDLELGRMYYRIFDHGGSAEERYAFIEKIAQYYGKADKGMLTKGDLGAYAMALQFTNNFSECYEVTTYALAKYPDDFGLNQFFLSSAVRMKKYDESIAAAQKLMKIDKEHMSALDYIRYGAALNGVKKYTEAIEQYNYVLTMESATDRNKSDANNQINNTIVDMCNEHVKMGEYAEAFSLYEKFIAERKAAGHLDAYLMGMYARAYIELSAEQNGDEKKVSLQKASGVYDQMAEMFPDRQVFALFSQFNIQTQLDPESEQGLAKPYADKLIDLILKQSDWSADAPKLQTAYYYLTYYNFIKRNFKEAISYADKLLDIQPGHPQAEKIKEISKKYARR
jgi:tetratricopeptide (TPR) repeat protein